jgi:hypothetical protein
LGYHHLHLLDDARKKRKKWMASSSGKTLVGLSAKSERGPTIKS